MGKRRIVSVSFFQSNVCNRFRKLPVVCIIGEPARSELTVMELGNVAERCKFCKNGKSSYASDLFFTNLGFRQLRAYNNVISLAILLLSFGHSGDIF